MRRGMQGHVAEPSEPTGGSLGGPSGRRRVARATRVHADARGGATWRVRGLAFEGTDERRPRGHQFHTVSCQKKVQTYQFDENISNLGV